VRPTADRVAELVFLGVVPILAVVLALSAYSEDGRIALDFHHELYRQAEAVVDGRDAYESPDADLSDRSNFLWPMAAVLPVVPVTALPPGVADWLVTAAMIASLVAALWILGVRDWRVYGVVAYWPSVIEAIQTANASLPLTLLVAVMWRYRDRATIAGLALGYGIAVKLFLWPVAVWLALIGRWRAAAIAAVSAAASLLLLLPFTSVADYVRLLRNLADTFEHDSYTIFALLTDVGVPDTAARAVTVALGLGVLWLAWHRRSLGLAIAAALVLSPIVWRHFFVLLAVPLALSRPRFDVVWLIPIGLWVGDGTFNGAPWQTASVLALVAITFLLCERGPRYREHATMKSHRIPAGARG
jgi:alpha-1,2-mannosyltransferase